MKYKFYEEKPCITETLSLDDEWVKYRDSNTHLYFKEINWIAYNTNTKVSDYFVDDLTFGDPVVFHVVNGYWGYLLNVFYYYFDTDDWNGLTK